MKTFASLIYSSRILTQACPLPSSPKFDWQILSEVYGLDRRYTGVRVDGIQIDLLGIMCQKIDLSNPLFEEKHIETAVQFCGAKSHE